MAMAFFSSRAQGAELGVLLLDQAQAAFELRHRSGAAIGKTSFCPSHHIIIVVRIAIGAPTRTQSM